MRGAGCRPVRQATPAVGAFIQKVPDRSVCFAEMDRPGLRGTAVVLEKGHAEARWPRGKDRRIPQLDPDRESHSALSAPPRAEPPFRPVQVGPQQKPMNRGRFGSSGRPEAATVGKGATGGTVGKGPCSGCPVRLRFPFGGLAHLREAHFCRHGIDPCYGVPPRRRRTRRNPSTAVGSPGWI